jgi:transcriptional regulator with XRE-family HTH domain
VKAALARNLHRLRESRGLTRKALARAAEIGVGAVREIEAGRSLAEMGVLIRLSDALGVSCRDLVDLLPAMPAPEPVRSVAKARIPEGALA